MYRRLRAAVKWGLFLALAGGLAGPVEARDLEERLERARDLEAALERLTGSLQDGRPVEVLAEIDALAEEVRADPRWANLHGLALAATGDHRAAVQRYTEGIRRDPDRAELHTNLAVSLVALGATGRALSEFEQATQLDPRSVDAHLGWGRELHRLRRHAAAVEPLERARDLAPRDRRVLELLGDAAAAAGDSVRALDAWREAEALAPDVRAARRMAELQARRDPSAALEAYERCLQRDPGALDCLEAAASLERGLGRTEAAADRLLAAVERIGPAALEILYLALWEGRGADDVASLGDRRPPSTAAGWGILGLALRERGRPVEALEAVDAGLSLAPGAPELHVLRGALLAESGRDDAARAAWRRALELDPDNAAARANLDAVGGG